MNCEISMKYPSLRNIGWTKKGLQRENVVRNKEKFDCNEMEELSYMGWLTFPLHVYE